MSEITPVTLVDEPKKQLAVLVQTNKLEVSSASQVLSTFEPLLLQAEEWAKKVDLIKVTDVSQTKEMELARVSRLALKEIRVNAEKARKRLKEDSLRQGKAIDGAYNIVEFIIAPLEQKLLDQENFAKNKEIERKASLKTERTAQIFPFLQNPVSELYGMVLEDMSEETFGQLLELKRMSHQARLDAALRIHEENIARQKAEAIERERLRIENERLQREAKEKEAALQTERARVDREKAEAAAAAKKEQLRLEAEAAKAAAERKAAEETARQERLRQQALIEVERQKVAAEKAAQQRKLDEAVAHAVAIRKQAEAAEAARLAEEQKRRDQEAAAARKAASAPDREKLHAVAKAVRELPLPALSCQDTRPLVGQALTEVADYIDSLAEAL